MPELKAVEKAKAAKRKVDGISLLREDYEEWRKREEKERGESCNSHSDFGLMLSLSLSFTCFMPSPFSNLLRGYKEKVSFRPDWSIFWCVKSILQVKHRLSCHYIVHRWEQGKKSFPVWFRCRQQGC